MTLSSSSTSNDSYILQSCSDYSGKSINSFAFSKTNGLEWKQLITSIASPINDNCKSNENKINKTSQEEDLTLQRKRILINGIFSYDFHPNLARFVFTMKNTLYWFDDVEMTEDCCNLNCDYKNYLDNQDNLNVPLRLGRNSSPYIPNILITNEHCKLNATICPHQPDLVAYNADNDLWVCDLITGCELRLTNTDYKNTAVMAARASFVMQEEFSRFNAFWWRPKCLIIFGNFQF